jgi:oligoribonuclease
MFHPLKSSARRWYPKVYFAAPAKDRNHRALGDIRDSIEELEYYRNAIFIPLN